MTAVMMTVAVKQSRPNTIPSFSCRLSASTPAPFMGQVHPLPRAPQEAPLGVDLSSAASAPPFAPAKRIGGEVRLRWGWARAKGLDCAGWEQDPPHAAKAISHAEALSPSWLPICVLVK